MKIRVGKGHKQAQNKIQVPIELVRQISAIKEIGINQTANLSKHLFQEIVSYLDVLALTNQLNHSQVTIIKRFVQCKGKLKSYNLLIKDVFLGQQCREFVESSDFIGRVLASRKMEGKTKIRIIRWLERIRRQLIIPSPCWGVSE